MRMKILLTAHPMIEVSPVGYSGSASDRDFINLLSIARRSAYENANTVLFPSRHRAVNQPKRDQLVERQRVLHARIFEFSDALG